MFRLTPVDDARPGSAALRADTLPNRWLVVLGAILIQLSLGAIGAR